ncbi:MAG: glycine oxidase ThiO [Mariprofundales bacterium]|nr:glycine oxidase ThiO [Mariprofundales bacterium]
MGIVIVGGGIIGCLTACRLRQQGADVTVVESGDIGREASWAGAGILCPIHPWLYPDCFSELVQHSLDLYPALQHQLLAQTGIDIEWQRSGLLIPFFGDESHWQPAQEWSQRFNWEVEPMDGAAARVIEPSLAPSVQRALLWPQVAQLRNPRLLKAVCKWMEQLGVEVRSHTKVRRLLVRDGEITGVELASDSEPAGENIGAQLGTQIDADQVLLAAGSWSDALLEPLGVALAIRPVKGQIILLATAPGTVRHIVKHDALYLVPRADGRVLVGATMEHVGFRDGNTVAEVHGLLDGLMCMFPGLTQCEIERQWMGFRPGSPDGMPFLGEIDGARGLFVASGHYRNGVALAPVTAECMAALMMGDPPEVEMAPFSPNRKINRSATLGYPSKSS